MYIPRVLPIPSPTFFSVLLVGLFFTGAVCCSAATPVFSGDEMVLLRMSEQEWLEGVSAARKGEVSDALPYSSGRPGQVLRLSDGPFVSIIDPRPRGKFYESEIPVGLLVFLKRHKAPIDIETLRITGKRGIFSLDVTDRLDPFLREPLDSENAEYVIDGEIEGLWPGRYQVVMSVADIEGNISHHSLFLHVRKEPVSSHW